MKYTILKHYVKTVIRSLVRWYTNFKIQS